MRVTAVQAYAMNQLSSCVGEVTSMNRFYNSTFFGSFADGDDGKNADDQPGEEKAGSPRSNSAFARPAARRAALREPYLAEDSKEGSLKQVHEVAAAATYFSPDTEPIAFAPHLEDYTRNAFNPVAAPAAPARMVSSLDDIDWSKLEDVPVSNTEDLPVAAALVENLELFPYGGRKRSRDSSPVSSGEETTEYEEATRFRSYQSDQWSKRFKELCEYRKQKGHCSVPHNYEKNLPLARWVKRQRYQYKHFKEDGQVSTMTEERIRALEEIGFVWDCQGTTWDERLSELRDYRAVFNDCNVPTNYPENQRLAMWVRCQRRQYKLYKEGKQSSMTQERIRVLESLGFSWGLRTHKKSRTV